MTVVGGIEAGGTKFICAVGSGPENIDARIEFPTTSPDQTMACALDFFRAQSAKRPLAAVGIASFGPIDVHRASPTFGCITSTPKPGWQNVDLAGPVHRALGVPIAFDTDVNAAAVGERRWGAAQGLNTFIYLTIGTGIGGGGMVEGRLMHGVLHPEMGHIRIPHDWRADPFPGSCPFHGDCWEGLAAGPAIEARWGSRGERLPPEDRAWQLEADYIALGVTSLICALAPERIILGGGVMRQAGLLPLIQQKTLNFLNNYIRVRQITDQIASYIVAPSLGGNSGVLGAMALASDVAASA